MKKRSPEIYLRDFLTIFSSYGEKSTVCLPIHFFI